jgi:predicted transcriptional regulator
MSTNEYLLLFLIEKDYDLSSLKQTGLNYHEIVKLIENAVDENLIIRDENRFRLTDEGKIYMENQIVKEIEPLLSLWIRPKTEYRIKKLDKKDIYLPSRNTVNKLR